MQRASKNTNTGLSLRTADSEPRTEPWNLPRRRKHEVVYKLKLYALTKHCYAKPENAKIKVVRVIYPEYCCSEDGEVGVKVQVSMDTP